ncbi:MAG: hypothetical protein Harvfovirus18_4 [Harvfovirus sp.]|uniref:Uncharacterized protein n=1 Tax=Harvfovirus sp. TaxID=2487768 RepID=A0A3G5A1M8_9VIRU|nr:MAG: hypothetical protein Harvfovirus18_4 [Harvfovirus sp.]
MSVIGITNAIRLESNMFSTKKILYIFSYNKPPYENDCSDNSAVSIKNFIIRQLDKMNRTATIYDMFIKYPFYFPFDALELQSKKSDSSIGVKIRYHQLDFNEIPLWNIFFNDYNSTIQILLSQDVTNIDNIFQSRNKVKWFVNDILIIMELFLDVPSKKPLEIPPYLTLEKTASARELIDKLKNDYSNEKVKKIMAIIFNSYLKEGLNSLLSIFEKIGEALEKIYKHLSVGEFMINPDLDATQDILPDYAQYPNHGPNYSVIRLENENILSQIKSLNMISDTTYVLLEDIYFLRRFLDKSYITNASLFTPSFLPPFVVYILTKYFEFTVTQMTNSRYDVDQLNKKISSTDLGKEFYHLFQPDMLMPCVDLSGFSMATGDLK